MTSVVAHGKTTMARAILRPRNLLFRIRASIKPRIVDSPTTATVQIRVFFITMPNDASLSTEEKFSNPAKPRIFPVLLTSLTAILNT